MPLGGGMFLFAVSSLVLLSGGKDTLHELALLSSFLLSFWPYLAVLGGTTQYHMSIEPRMPIGPLWALLRGVFRNVVQRHEKRKGLPWWEAREGTKARLLSPFTGRQQKKS